MMINRTRVRNWTYGQPRVGFYSEPLYTSVGNAKPGEWVVWSFAIMHEGKIIGYEDGWRQVKVGDPSSARATRPHIYDAAKQKIVSYLDEND